MSKMDQARPVIMSLSYHEPTGAGGIQADIETTASLGCHCATILTALCARDTQGIKDLQPIDTTMVIEQTRAILEDMPIKVIKLGYLGRVDTIEAVYTILQDYPHIPVVIDPTLSLYSRYDAEHNYRQTLLDLLLPLGTLIISNSKDIFNLAHGADGQEACAAVLLDGGCEHVLINDCDENHQNSQARLFDSEGLLDSHQWCRLNLHSHGKCAILSSAIAGYLAQGLNLRSAVGQGLRYCWQALAASERLGMGAPVPNCMHWAKTSAKDFNDEIAVDPDKPEAH